MSKYLASFSEIFYEDNYNEGEVEGTCQWSDLGTEIFTSIAEAVKYFKERAYGDKIETTSVNGRDDEISSSTQMKAPDSEGGTWRFPTDQDIAKWKKGEINLWNVELLMRLEELAPVPVEEISEEIKKAS